MSRSRKKTAAGGNTTASSEKGDKKIWHKKYRRISKAVARHDKADTDTIYPVTREVSNVWSMDKDGKGRYDWLDEKTREKFRRK